MLRVGWEAAQGLSSGRKCYCRLGHLFPVRVSASSVVSVNGLRISKYAVLAWASPLSAHTHPSGHCSFLSACPAAASSQRTAVHSAQLRLAQLLKALALDCALPNPARPLSILSVLPLSSSGILHFSASPLLPSCCGSVPPVTWITGRVVLLFSVLLPLFQTHLHTAARSSGNLVAVPLYKAVH